MPDATDGPPANAVAATWWGLKWLSTLTPDRILMLLFVSALVMMYSDQRQDKLSFRQEMGERLDQRERDQLSERENNRKHELSLVGSMLKNSNEQDKIRRDEDKSWKGESERHMKAAEGTLRELATASRETSTAAKENALAVGKLAAAVEAFTKKVDKMGPMQ